MKFIYKSLFLVIVYFISRVILFKLINNVLFSSLIELIVLCYITFIFFKKTHIPNFKIANGLELFSDIIIFLVIQISVIIFLDTNYSVNKNNLPTIDICFAICFIGPICEELFFRYILLNKLYKNHIFNVENILKSIFLSIIFCFIHFSHNFYETLNHFIFSFLIYLLYLKYRNIYLVIILHIIWNSFMTFNGLYYITSFDLGIFWSILIISSIVSFIYFNKVRFINKNNNE
jgi:membrane protease YdiL (CAAX protease family)